MYKIVFANNTAITQNLCSWDKMPDIPIKEVYYYFGNNKALHMCGFDKYLILFEKVSILGKKEFPLTVNLLAEKNNNVYQFSVYLPTRKAKQRKDVVGKEFASLLYDKKNNTYVFGVPQKTNPDLWKKGVSGQLKIELL